MGKYEVRLPAGLTLEQAEQVKRMAKKQRKILLRKDREERNGRKLLDRLKATAARGLPRPVLNKHEERLLKKLAVGDVRMGLF